MVLMPPAGYRRVSSGLQLFRIKPQGQLLKWRSEFSDEAWSGLFVEFGEILWGPQKTSGNEEVHRKGKRTARMDRHLGKGTSVTLLSSIARPCIFRVGRRSLHSQFSFPGQPLSDHSLHQDGFWRQTCLVTQNLDSTIYDLKRLIS